MSSIRHFIAAAAAILCVVAVSTSCDGFKPLPQDTTSPEEHSITNDTTPTDALLAPVTSDTTHVLDSIANQSIANLTETPNPLLDSAIYIPRGGNKFGGKLISLTFDDGPNTKTTPLVLDALKKFGAHATFFCVGRNITDKTRHLVKRAVDEGNEIASHTWSHPFLSRISHEKRTTEMKKTADAIYDAVGYYPNFYRPPYLDCSQSVLADINLPAISGSASDDWMTKMTPDMITEKVLSTAKHGAIYVMHDFVANERTPEALLTLIPRLQEQGYTLVTVSDLFASLGVTPEGHTLYTCGERVAKRAGSPKSKAKSDGKKSKSDDKKGKSDDKKGKPDDKKSKSDSKKSKSDDKKSKSDSKKSKPAHSKA